MSLITCEECGKEISSTAENCPHCGHKTPVSKVNAQKKSITIATYICMIAAAVGLILLIPSLITLAQNYNDWYFWNWYTDRSDAVVRNIGLGVGLCGSGFGCLAFLLNKAKKEKAQKDTNASL